MCACIILSNSSGFVSCVAASGSTIEAQQRHLSHQLLLLLYTIKQTRYNRSQDRDDTRRYERQPPTESRSVCSRMPAGRIRSSLSLSLSAYTHKQSYTLSGFFFNSSCCGCWCCLCLKSATVSFRSSLTKRNATA